jgi:predicted nucleic acid-binding protein
VVRGKAEAVDQLKVWVAEGDELLMASVSRFEIGVGIGRLAAKSARKRAAAWNALTAGIECADFSANAADVAAALQANFLARGRPAPLADLFIAATAASHNCDVVVTRDLEDFRRIGLVAVESH